MNYVIDPLKGLVCTVFGLCIHPAIATAAIAYALYFRDYSALVLVLPCLLGIVAILSARWEEVDGLKHGYLPDWAFIWSTPDESLPGDLKEPTLLKIDQKFGVLVASLYWLLERNRGLGLAFKFGKKLEDGVYIDGDKWGYQKLASGAWRMVIPLGFVYLGFGNQTTKDRQGNLWALPWCSVRVPHDGHP